MIQRAVVSLTCLLIASLSGAQITLGQVDDFQDGTLMNWGPGGNLQNIANGGPAGAGDRFLQVTSDGGGGTFPRLATFNTVQWSGNYQAAGVNSVGLHMINLGQTDLSIRLVLFDFNGPQTRWTSTVSQNLAAGGGWQSMTFSVLQADLTRVFGTGTYSNMITGANRLMFRHQSGAPAAEGTIIQSQMGMDNVTAVPEPATFVALGLGALLLRRRKRA